MIVHLLSIKCTHSWSFVYLFTYIERNGLRFKTLQIQSYLDYLGIGRGRGNRISRLHPDSSQRPHPLLPIPRQTPRPIPSVTVICCLNIGWKGKWQTFFSWNDTQLLKMLDFHPYIQTENTSFCCTWWNHDETLSNHARTIDVLSHCNNEHY